MPIVEAVKSYLAKNYLRLHMPGHKGICAQSVADLLDRPFKADLTELPGTDDLHAPMEAIAEAENLAAELYSAQKTIFLVNGATQGITALMSLDIGKKIILPRHAHKSLYNGLILSGARPIYIKSKLLPDWEVAQGIDFNHYCSIAANNLDVAQVWLTSPTYFGHLEDIKLIKKFLPDNARLFVDEAHGAHLKFVGIDDAITQGAHAAVQSWHKTLGALTQSAVIHFSDKHLPEKARKTISLTETTSPSYLLLLSLDAARNNMALQGKDILRETITNVRKFISEIQNLNYVKIMPTDDITKISLRVEGLTGYQLSDYLIGKGIMPEMAQDKFVLLQTVLYFMKEDVTKLVIALKELKTQTLSGKGLNIVTPAIPEMAMLPREAFYAENTNISLKQAIGKISTEFVIPYPPGIPVLVPGEIVDTESVEYIDYIKSLGAKFQGPADKELNMLKVAIE